MAKATSGLGQFRGKVGSVVFRVNQGQQIASAYQPAVRNPKSNLQTAQRNKMYLASQLSKEVPREDIIGLAPMGSARDRRTMFIKNIINNSTSTLEGEVFQSSINYLDVVFSNGKIIIYDIAENENALSVSIGDMTEEEYDRLAIKAISFIVSPGYGIGAYKSGWVPLPAYSTLSNGTISLSGVGGAGYITYLIPVMLKDNVRYSEEKKSLIQFGDSGNFVITGEYATNNAVLEWGRSMAFASRQDGEIVPPSTGGDEVVNPDGPSFPNLG